MFKSKQKKTVDKKTKKGTKKQVSPVEDQPIVEDEVEVEGERDFLDNTAKMWDVMAPEGLAIQDEDHGVIKQSFGTRTYFRPFYAPRDGYPRKMETNWLSGLYNAGEVDVMIHSKKSGASAAIRRLQKAVNSLKASRLYQVKKGNQDQLMDLNTKINDTEILMEQIQFSDNDLFDVSITGMIYAESKYALDKASETLEDEMSSKFFKITSAWGRVKKAMRSSTPLGYENELRDSWRNLDRRSLATMSPFISGNGIYNGGIPIGVNVFTGQKEFYNAFGTPENKPDNYNMAIFGVSGSGKSLALKLLLARETVALGIYSRLIDVEGEFVDTVNRLGGININLSEESHYILNPFVINVSFVELKEENMDEELELLEQNQNKEIVEKHGKTYIAFLPILEKINESIDWFDIVCRGKNQEDRGLTVFERDFLEQVLKKLFYGRYTQHPSSLYEEDSKVVDGQLIQSKVKKPEITLSDIYKLLVEMYGEERECARLIAAIRPFLRDGSKPIFDGQTHLGKHGNIDINKARLVNFNISKMEEGFLLPVTYHVILKNLWEYFAKNPELALVPKIIYADEYVKLIDDDVTVSFSEKVARRIRKRNGGLRIASQDTIRIMESKKARGVLQNTHTIFFLKQTKMDLKLTKENFDLSQGELDILFSNPEKGHGILRSGNSSVYIRTDPSEDEMMFVESNAAELDKFMKKLKKSELI